MSIFGNPVMLGGSGGGGGGDVPLLTRAQWNALSTAQKQAYGLLAIQDANSGFNRGELVYGAAYIASLLISSVAADVLTEAFAEYFNSGDNKWGDFDIIGSVASKDGDAVRFAGAWARCGLSAVDTPVTVYCVFRQDPVQTGDLAIIGVPYAESNQQNPAFYSRNGTLMRSTYGAADTSIGLSASDNYHVLTLVCDRGTSYYYVDEVLKGNMTYSHSGSIVGLAGSVGGARKIQGLYLYAAVVNGAETGDVVVANQQNIMAHYGLS